LDLNEAVDEVIVLTGSEALKNGISVKTQLADDLRLIEGDRVQLQQVLLNLVVNAIQAMATIADGARDLLITTASSGSDSVLVRVADSGPGLDPQMLEHVFDPYYTTKPRGAVFQFRLPADPGDGL
jgi:C4-dicarboxylate-specific signal transduction histidine kinase